MQSKVESITTLVDMLPKENRQRNEYQTDSVKQTGDFLLWQCYKTHKLAINNLKNVTYTGKKTGILIITPQYNSIKVKVINNSLNQC